ncbi:hypothetical protein BOX15_Mlig032557g1 [Macrostomum lignano]|uniref:Uncharacterized protein n=1 Tax=Macrostomum lignano TaxID=282301 RepID=A0A267F554_9PLAT|nr:hypothetical protein BOX15_Mlig032557g1 [Macrostomum lignano]
MPHSSSCRSSSARPSPGCSPSASTRDSRCRRCKSRRRRQPEADRDSRRRRPSRTPASPSASSRSQSASSATFYTRASGDSSATATPEWSSGSRGLTKGKAVFPPWRLVENVEEFDRRRRRRHKRRERLKSERSSPASSNNSSNQRDQLPSASPRQEQPQQTPKHRGQTRHLSTINNMNSVIEPQDSKNHLQPPQLQQARPAVYQRYTDANRSARLSITGSRDHLPLAEHQMPQPQWDRCNYQPVSTGHAKRQPAVTLDYRYPIEQGISFDTAHDLSQRQKHGLARQYSGQMQWQNYQYDLNERQQQHLQHHPQRPQWHQNNQNQQKFTRNWQRHYQQPQQRYQQPPPRSYQQPLFTREDEFPVREQQAWHPRSTNFGFPDFDDVDPPGLRRRNGDDFAPSAANFSGITGPADEPQFPGPPTPYPCGPPSQPQFDDRQGAWPSRHVDEGFPNFDDGDSPDLRQRNGDDFALPPANFSSSVAYPAGGLHVPWRDSGWPGLQAGAQQFGQTPQFPDQPTPFPCGPPSQQQFNDFNVGGFNSFGLV